MGSCVMTKEEHSNEQIQLLSLHEMEKEMEN